MTKFYRVILSGSGGEAVTSKATPEEYKYWIDQIEQRRAEFEVEEDDDPIYEYLTAEDFGPSKWDSVPDEFVREIWSENDDLLHIFGVEVSQGYLTVEEIDSDDVHSADVIETLVDEETLESVSQEYSPEYETHEVEDWCSHEGPVLFGFSHEKGEFFRGLIEIQDGELDVSALSFTAHELHNYDTIVSTVHYKGNEVFNDGGDTRGVALYIEMYDSE